MDAVEAAAEVARGKIGRGARTWGQLWQAPTFLVGLLVFVAVAVTSPYRAHLREGPFEAQLRGLRQNLHDGAPPADLIAAVDTVLAQAPKYPRRQAEAHFLAGSVYFRLAESSKNPDCQARSQEHLEKAQALRVSEADEPALLYRLGVLYYRRGNDVPHAIELMSQGVDKGADDPHAAYALLVEAYLRLPDPDLDGVLAASQKLLEMAADSEALGQIRYLRSELLARKEQRLDALKELERITGKITKELRIKTRLLQARMCEEEGLWNRAAASWKDLQGDAADIPGGAERIFLAYGHCLASADPPNYEAAASAWQKALESGGAAGQAAGLRLGEVRLFLPPGAPDQALAVWTQALRSVMTASDYKNPYFDITKARDLFERSYRHFFEGRDYARAQETAELYKKLAAAGVAEELWAEAVEAQAKQAQAKTEGGGSENATWLNKARGQFQLAGEAYEQAARARTELEQVECWWRSAQCFLASNDLPRAAVALERFVTQAKEEPRLAQAWYALAETQFAQGRKDAARQAYYKCIEFPATPYAWRARYQLAVEEIAQKNFVHAKEILKQNLTAASPSMDREAHEKSIYKMAGLLLQMKAYDEAVVYLKEAWRQYPKNASALDARDRLAFCYRNLAEQAERKLRELDAAKLEGIPSERKAALDEMKSQQQRERRQWLEQALHVYEDLAEEMRRKADRGALTKEEAVVQRKAVFAIGDVLFEMNRFTEALRQYQRLQQDYAKQVEGLFACHRIFKCIGVMVESAEQIRQAREASMAATKQARSDLGAMDEKSECFRGEGVWTKENWQTWLNWADQQLNPAPTPTARPNPLFN